MAEVTFAKQFLNLLDSRPVKLPSDYVADPKALAAQPAYILPKNPTPYTKSRTSTSTSSAPAAQTGSDPSAATAATEPALQVSLVPLRRTPTSPGAITIPVAAPAQTSIYDLKALCAQRTGYAPDKIKLLWNKKPAPDSKTVAELVGAAGSLELGVMFVGAATAAPAPDPATPVPPGTPAPPDSAGDVAGAQLAAGAPPAEAAAAAAETRDAAQAQDVEMEDPAAVAQGASGRAVLETQEFWDDLRGFVVQRVRDEEVGAALVRAFREAWRLEAGKGST